jgi:ubiquinone/menaquinone biosynthesis C-methylase UbiE
MRDPYAVIAAVDEEIQTRLADVLELRASDPQQRAMLDSYLAEIQLPKGARVLEVGCGTGAVTRRIAELFEVDEVIGIDPSQVFIDKARDLSKHMRTVSFCRGDGQSMEFRDGFFDLVVFHTVLCHLLDPQIAIEEARRVLRPDGWLAVFDGDYTTTSVALKDSDPLQQAAQAMVTHFVNDRWLIRRLPKMLSSEGFRIVSFRSHGYTQTEQPTYMFTIVDRGADLLASNGDISDEAATELKSEARRREKDGEFFGHISFVSAIARPAK